MSVEDLIHSLKSVTTWSFLDLRIRDNKTHWLNLYYEGYKDLIKYDNRYKDFWDEYYTGNINKDGINYDNKHIIENALDEKNKPLSFINPKIKKISDETSIYEEGCLSIPDTFIEIERPKICEVEYIDLDGKVQNMKCDGLLSTCLQHEINHLDGKLIIDHLSKLKRDLIIKKISKTKKTDIQIMINNEETGLALLRIAEVIGQDRIENLLKCHSTKL